MTIHHACQACSREVIYMTTASGIRIAFDPEPNLRGVFELVDPDQLMVAELARGKLRKAREERRPLFERHFLTCPSLKHLRNQRNIR